MLRQTAAALIFIEMKKLITLKKNDIILIITLLAVCSIAFLVMFLARNEGAYAVVIINGQETESYPLNEDMTVKLSNGDGYNILTIEDGYARIESASCPDKLCVKKYKVCYNGESLVCLPNKTTVKIVSKINPETDFIS